jgi:hypothetical protein
VSDLQHRLQRLRRPSDTEASASGLERLERELLGEAKAPAVEELLPLKARLERLVAVAARRERRRVPPPVPLEELVDGMRVENERGEFFLVESSVHLELRHGDVPLSRFHAIEPDTVGVLTAEPELEAFDLRRAVFLDTETTGLAGGAGTAAFLIGVGFVDGERFRVRQYFMRDYHEEGALLHALALELLRFRHLVTFNGRMFDVPLLDARYRLNRGRFPLAGAAHLDLLLPARRLWKARLESCRLVSLEAELLGLRRHGDISGEQIPQVYFDWVRRRDARLLARVFEHNRQDIVSLAALAVLACQWVEESRAEDPRDVLSLGRVLERGRRYERSEACYWRAVAAGAEEVRGPALLRLASRAKRTGDHTRAAELWAAAGAAGEPSAWRELAMHHEHRSRDLEQALAAAERGLRLVEARAPADAPAARLARDFDRRLARLFRKQEKKTACAAAHARGNRLRSEVGFTPRSGAGGLEGQTGRGVRGAGGRGGTAQNAPTRRSRAAGTPPGPGSGRAS